jgi:acetyl esterase/lipase
MQLPRVLFASALLCLNVLTAGAAESAIPLWPQGAPGEQDLQLPAETDLTKPNEGKVADKTVIRLGNVSAPSLTFHPAPAAQNTGTTVLVCPGGGYNILALDLEGTEVCDWLNSLGVNAALLKYRVPGRKGRARHEAPLEDAQRAIGLLRQRAVEWKLDPQRIGILGFSAGGHLAAVASNQFEKRGYNALDEADQQSCRPDFTVLIYPAYLALKDEGNKIAPELPISAKTPPTFIAMSQDDPVRVENALFYSLALKEAKVPCELHVYPSGGHGYGLRPSDHLVTTWPARAADWMRSRGLLKSAP